jgi:tRNA pseudouridine55 synthase
MIQGIVNVLKPPGMTSHDVVSFMRKVYGIKRIGHAGTLDPAAAGVLPVAVGPATRLLEYMTERNKSYRVELTFGYETDSGDDTGKIINTQNCSLPPRGLLEKTLATFIGTYDQIPPMHSAIKVNGKKLYELAREGITIERKPRTITIEHLQLIAIRGNTILFDVICSKGTYIRSLCADIGKRMDCPAVMSFLVRTQVGTFSLENSHTPEEIAAFPEKVILPPDAGILHLPKVVLSPEQAEDFLHGRTIYCAEPVQKSEVIAIYNHKHIFIGIGNKQDRHISPEKVLTLA